MKIATVILARKGSKRIPFKNMKDFCGKPLIHYTLQTAKELDYNIYCMTDFKEIKDYILDQKFACTIIDMPKEFAEDKHDLMGSLNYIHKKAKADIYILLQPTSPIRDSKLIKGWVEDFLHNKFQCAMSLYRLPNRYFYVANIPVNFDMKDRDGNEGHKDNVYMENGSFYIFRKDMLKEKFIIKHPCQFYCDKFGVELDNILQWQPCENLYKQLQKMEEK